MMRDLAKGHNQALPDSSFRSFLLNSSYQGLANLYYLVIRAIYVIVFARLVGVELYGYYSYANNWYVIWLPLASWGMQELLISQYARTEPSRRDSLAGTGLGLRLLLSSTLALVVALAASGLEPDPELRLLIMIYSQGIIARGISNWFCALFIARERSVYWLRITVISLTLEVLLALALAHGEMGLKAIAIAQVTVWWLTALAAGLVYRWRFGQVRPRFDFGQVRFYLSHGIFLAAATFILGCLGPGLLVIYRYLIVDLERLGEMAFVLQVFAILGQITRVVSNSALPPLSRTSGSRDERLGVVTATIWKQALYFGGAMFVAGYWLLEPLVAWLVGEDFAPAARLFGRYSWLLIPLFMMHGLRLVLITTRQQHLLLLAIFSGSVALGVQIFLLHHFGRLDGETLLAALGLSYIVIDLILVKFIWTDQGGFSARDVLIPPVTLAASLALSFAVSGLASIAAAVAGVVPLLVASLLSFRGAHRELVGGGKGAAVR
jgi:O-antigen/teichoic acid export membrane protein